MALLVSGGIRIVRRKSPPVPSGTIASFEVVGIGAPLWKKPLTTSLRVPSPPTATTTGRDWRTAALAMSVASLGRVVMAVSYGMPAEGSQDSTFAQSRAPFPAPEAGLTMNSTGAPSVLIAQLPPLAH